MPETSYFRRLGRLLSVVFILPSCMAVGGLAGFFLIDRPLHSYPWGTVALVLIGAVAGFYEIFQALARDQRGNDE